MNTNDRLILEIDRASVLEHACLEEACSADLPVEKRERAEQNHKLASGIGQKLRTTLARRILLAP